MLATVTKLRAAQQLTEQDIVAILSATPHRELSYGELRGKLPNYTSIAIIKLLVEMSRRDAVILTKHYLQLNEMIVRLPR